MPDQGSRSTLAFFNFPAEHWINLPGRRTPSKAYSHGPAQDSATKGSLSSTTARLMVFSWSSRASKTWRRKRHKSLAEDCRRCQIKDGIEVLEVPENHAA